MTIQTTLLGRECRPAHSIDWDRGRIVRVWTDNSNVLWVAIETDKGRIVQIFASDITLLPEGGP